jgi:hypothetical protein
LRMKNGEGPRFITERERVYSERAEDLN